MTITRRAGRSRLALMTALTLLPGLLSMALLPTTLQAQVEKPFGINQRVPWTGSKLIGTAEPPSPFLIERVFPKVEFQNPVELLPVPGSDELLVLEVAGKLWTVPNHEEAERELVVDLKEQISEFQRSYGFAFHPDFASNGYCYIAISLPVDFPTGQEFRGFE